MGAYLDPNGPQSSSQAKRDWLAAHAKPLADAPKTITENGETELPLALLDNGSFIAVAIAFEQAELDYFLTRDREIEWYTASIKDLAGASSLPHYMNVTPYL